MKTVIVGRAIEYEVFNTFERLGFFVMRSAGSHGKVDVYVASPEFELFIQCKKDKKAFSKKEREEFIELAHRLNKIPVLAYRDRGIWLEFLDKNRTIELRNLSLNILSSLIRNEVRK